MSVTTEKPVVTAAQVTAAVGLLWPAFLAVCTAFDWWDPTQDQLAALTALAGAITAAVGLLTGKVAASRVFVASSVERETEAAHEKAHAEDAERIAEADERVRVAESFGTPHQDQSPHPLWGQVGGRGDGGPSLADLSTPQSSGAWYLAPQRSADPHDHVGRRSGHPGNPDDPAHRL